MRRDGRDIVSPNSGSGTVITDCWFGFCDFLVAGVLEKWGLLG